MPWTRDQTVFGAETVPKLIAYEVKNFALLDENVERVHDFFDRGGVVPPVYVEKVDIRRTQLLERGFHGHVKGLGVVPRIVH